MADGIFLGEGTLFTVLQLQADGLNDVEQMGEPFMSGFQIGRPAIPVKSDLGVVDQIVQMMQLVIEGILKHLPVHEALLLRQLLALRILKQNGDDQAGKSQPREQRAGQDKLVGKFGNACRIRQMGYLGNEMMFQNK